MPNSCAKWLNPNFSRKSATIVGDLTNSKQAISCDFSKIFTLPNYWNKVTTAKHLTDTGREKLSGLGDTTNDFRTSTPPSFSNNVQYLVPKWIGRD
ncbi:hypothetical protein DERF_002659 [Dermatophagoides farinae]|uniref:Uncharacterized protein n=1 Tax=Dermatophagoides farinae TaxID=6954 RepID=A0A922IB31_DERFA|nr:hypothetical protein DERF_002659 [Dermatophagoides farinae]